MLRSITSAALAVLLSALPLAAQSPDPIQAALAASTEAERAFNGHIQFLAHPFMAGRLPGTQGMDITRDYMEAYFRGAGLAPAFGAPEGAALGEGGTSYRQSFSLSATRRVSGQAMTSSAFASPLSAGLHYRATAAGGVGSVEGEVVFAGYGVQRLRTVDGFSGYNDDDSFEGKIVMVFRFEPMTTEGTSRAMDQGWSRSSRTLSKLRLLAKKNPAAIIIANPPGCADPRAETLADLETSSRRSYCDVPVHFVSTDTAEQLAKAAGQDLMALRQQADQGRAVVPLGVNLKLESSVEEKGLEAQNVAGILRGKGALADELVVVGAHIDHLGMGNFGSRDPQFRGKKVHPGADDNASGAAAIIMMAETLVQKYRELPDGASARSVLFIGFDAEEQGLLGARHYLTDPLVPAEQHALMINFDMIGRLTENKISVQGMDSAVGLKKLLEPAVKATELEVVDQRIIPASDHWPFYSAGIPILFSICHSLREHPDYHTSRDTAWRINVRDGVKAVHLYDDFLYRVATHGESFEFQGRGR